MDGNKLSFSGDAKSNANASIVALISHLSTNVKDSIGQKIWQFVGRGSGLPDYGASEQTSASVLMEDQAPGIIIQEHLDEHISTTTVWIDATVKMHLSLKCFLFLPGTESGINPDVQDVRRNITKATLRALRPASDDNPNGWTSDQFPWWVEEPQIITVDYGNNFRNDSPDFLVEPPWWGWRIDMAVVAWNIK